MRVTINYGSSQKVLHLYDVRTLGEAQVQILTKLNIPISKIYFMVHQKGIIGTDLSFSLPISFIKAPGTISTSVITLIKNEQGFKSSYKGNIPIFVDYILSMFSRNISNPTINFDACDLLRKYFDEIHEPDPTINISENIANPSSRSRGLNPSLGLSGNSTGLGLGLSLGRGLGLSTSGHSSDIASNSPVPSPSPSPSPGPGPNISNNLTDRSDNVRSRVRNSGPSSSSRSRSMFRPIRDARQNSEADRRDARQNSEVLNNTNTNVEILRQAGNFFFQQLDDDLDSSSSE
ncbi:MAG: hypothetical protein WD512_09560, partial [Candidatus Paceibacterota bacterium]